MIRKFHSISSSRHPTAVGRKRRTVFSVTGFHSLDSPSCSALLCNSENKSTKSANRERNDGRETKCRSDKKKVVRIISSRVFRASSNFCRKIKVISYRAGRAHSKLLPAVTANARQMNRKKEKRNGTKRKSHPGEEGL